jgi:nucleoid-associated protein YgaU
MPLKQALGGTAVPVAGGIALVAAVAIGVVLVTQRNDEAAVQTAPASVSTTQPVADVAVPKTATAAPKTTQAPQETQPADLVDQDSTRDSREILPAPVDLAQDTGVQPENAKPTAEPSGIIEAPTTETSAMTGQDTGVETSENAPAEPAQRMALTAPSIDVVRIPQSGISTVAGRADAGSDVAVYIDGVEVARAEAGSSGEFVALFDVPAVDHPREMQVFAQRGDDSAMAEASVIIAPAMVAPVIQTQAMDEPADTPPAAQVQDLAETSRQTADQDTAQVTEAAAAQVSDTLPQSDPSQPPSAAPTVMIADDTGVKILQSAAPISGVTIDAITYDPAGAVFASGRGKAGNTVRLYLDTDKLIDTQVGPDGQWRVELPVKAGIYSLRADMIDDTGKVLSRVQIPFKREDIAVLAELSAGAAQDAQLKPDDATAGEAPADPNASSREIAPTRLASVTVQPGNTLWGIASQTYGDGFLYARVFNANVAQITDPDLIYPGQVFVLPQEEPAEAQ